MEADLEADLEADMQADLVRNLSHGALAFATARARRVCIRRPRKCEGRAQSPASQTFVGKLDLRQRHFRDRAALGLGPRR
jgi:hypothetical protein